MSEELDSRRDELESLVEQQQERTEEQAETIESQQETIEDQQERLDWLDELDEELEAEFDGSVDEFDEEAPDGIDRRSAIKAGGLLALAGLGAGSAGANPTGQVGTSNRPLNVLYAQDVVSDFFDFDGTLMELEAFEDSNTGNDVFAVSSATGTYGTLVEQFEVNEVGDATVAGSLSVGGDGSEQRTAGPIAKGFVPADPSSNSPNTVNVDNVEWNSNTGFYEITITNVSYKFDEYVTVLTSTDTGVTFDAGSLSNDLTAEPDDNSQHAFYFVTYGL